MCNEYSDEKDTIFTQRMHVVRLIRSQFQPLGQDSVARERESESKGEGERDHYSMNPWYIMFLILQFTLCAISYYPWPRHPIEETNSFCFLPKDTGDYVVSHSQVARIGS